MRYKIIFSYDGTNFNGYQKQLDKKSVQGLLESSLTKINNNNEVFVSSSGRTDANVHAINQCAHFDMKDMDENLLRNSANKLIFPSVYIKKIEKKDENFHARFDVISKTYLYKINIQEYNPIEVNYIYQLNKDLDIEKMQNAAQHLLGKHDFSSFTKKDNTKETYVRTINYIKITNNEYVSIEINGDGFLRYMVRNIVGSLLDVGLGKKEPDYIKEILLSKDRSVTGVKAPACGLYLKEVFYE